MSHSAHKTEAEYKEYFDPPDVLEDKVNRLVKYTKQSKHFIAFTGAGVSTAAGVRDFRSGVNTVLNTGPGAWTARAALEQASDKRKAEEELKQKSKVSVSTLKAIPTITHMSLVDLQRRGFLKFLVSQNTDGLHRRSGFPPENLAELHGNSNLEKCVDCHKEYLRDFRCREAQGVKEHITTRTCTRCGGKLMDTIINFGESLPEKALTDAFEHADKADLCLSMGSSLRVTPAADVPRIVGKNRILVVVNLQATPLDSVAKLRINATCDTVMQMVMEKLHFRIPAFKLRRYVNIDLAASEERGLTVNTTAVDVDNTPFTLFRSVAVHVTAPEVNRKMTLKKEPYEFAFRPNGQDAVSEMKKCDVRCDFEFFGHYQEPMLNLPLTNVDVNSRRQFMLEFDPAKKEWAVKPREIEESREVASNSSPLD